MLKSAALPGRGKGPKPTKAKGKDKDTTGKDKIGAHAPISVSTPKPKMVIDQSRMEQPSTQLANVNSPIAEQAQLVLQSRFGGRAEQIISMLEFQDSDGAISLLSRSILQTLVDVLPLAEHNIRATKGQKGIYQLNQLVSSVREMMIDLQALRDKGLVGQRLVESTIRPAFMDIGVQIVTAFAKLEASARNSMSDTDFADYRKELKGLRDNMGSYIQTQYQEVQSTVVTSLS